MELIIIGVILIIITLLIYIFFRRKYVKFTTDVEKQIDSFVNGEFDKKNINEENLESKLNSKLYKLGNITKSKL